MNIMEFGAIGELLAGVAMVATLMYLAIQIRHSASLAQGTAERGLMEAVQTMTDRLARNPKIWQQGLRSFDTVPSQDQLIFTSMFNPWVSHLERAVRMRSCGLLSQDDVDLYGDSCLSMVREPGGPGVWARTKPLYFPMSRTYIQSRLDDGSNLPPRISDVLPWQRVDERKGE